MAIVKVKKVSILGNASVKEHFLDTLAQAEIIHLKEPSDKNIGVLDDDILNKKIEIAIKALSAYDKQTIFSSIAPSVFFVKESEFSLLDRDDVMRKVEEVVSLQEKLNFLDSQIQVKEKIKNLFKEYFFIPFSFDDLHLKFFTIKVILLPYKMDVRTVLEESTAYFKLKEDKKYIYYLLLVVKEDEKKLLERLKEHNIEEKEFPVSIWQNYSSLTPSEIVEKIDVQISALRARYDVIKERIKRYLPYRKQFMLMYDYFLNGRYTSQLSTHLPTTDYFFGLEGWILVKDVKRFLKLIDKFNRDIYVLIQDPQPGEMYPTKLQNHSLVSPFEIIVNLYGPISPYAIDPTVFVAPFLFLFVGICISDAGYGVILAVLGWYLLKKFNLSTFARRGIKLLLFTGMSTILWGIIFGGFLGISLPSKIFDLANNPFPFLLFCFALGAFQILIGMLIKAYIGIKNKNYAQAFLQLSWIVFLASLVLVFFFNNFLVKSLVIVSLLGIINFSSSHRNILVKLGVGLYELYGVTKYFSDVLSYSRLLALGMATGVIAMVVNILAKLILQVPFVGIFLAAVVFIIGHSFNLFINLLGGFIHSVRLHFVEFFSKFFDLGEVLFSPLKRATKYSYIIKKEDK